jgi:hypothetical protein
MIDVSCLLKVSYILAMCFCGGALSMFLVNILMRVRPKSCFLSFNIRVRPAQIASVTILFWLAAQLGHHPPKKRPQLRRNRGRPHSGGGHELSVHHTMAYCVVSCSPKESFDCSSSWVASLLIFVDKEHRNSL